MVIHTQTKTVLADIQTPVSIYLKVRDVYPESALLESSDYHGNENSYSMIGLNPMARFEAMDGQVRMNYPDGLSEENTAGEGASVSQLLYRFIKQFETTENSGAINGFFGYTAYDAVKYFSDVNPCRSSPPDENRIMLPDIVYILYRYILIINHFKNEMSVVENRLECEESRIDELLALLDNRNFASYNFKVHGSETSTVSDDEYKTMATRAIELCNSGEASRIVLSRRFSQAFTGDDFKVYRALRSINPSPYLFYFDFGSFRIFGSSPETHCNISNGRAFIDVVAGSVARTGDDRKDRKLARELPEDPKGNAEHLTLIDLAHKDLFKNTENVRVDFFKEVQFYSHVLRSVSRVVGDVPVGSNTLEIFAETFPAATHSGAPKQRAMELIRDLEPHSREVYGGCTGYIGLNGDMNKAVAIRSFVSKNNVLYYQAGAGIVSNSDATSKLHEVNKKLDALKKAIDEAERIIN